MERKATIVKLAHIREHPNADRVNLTTIYGNQVVIGKNYKEGDIGLFFEVDTQLSEDFCKFNNLYRDNLKNFDTDQSGYFDDNRRVRAQTFRNEKSEGFFAPISYLDYLEEKTGVLKEDFNINIGDEFNVLYGQEICKKYVSPFTKRNRTQSAKKALMKELAPYFKEHFDTEQYFKQIERNPDIIKKGDLVYITEKLHGTSIRFGNGKVLKSRKTNWFERVFLGKPERELTKSSDYKFVVGSRRVLKSINEKAINGGGWYSEDIWTEAALPYKDKLFKGETIYGELVGYQEDGSPIMGTHSNEKLKPFLSKEHYKEFIKLYGETTEFNYGCTGKGVVPEKAGSCRSKIFVYRITMTNEDGVTYDLSWEQVKQRCAEIGIDYVPEIEKLIVGNHKGIHLETDEHLYDLDDIVKHTTDIPSRLFPEHIKEGICIRVESSKKECTILKNKGFIFKVLEGIVKEDVEEQQK